MTVVVKLRENVVPDLNIAVTVAADGAVGSSAAVFLAAVVIYLRAGAAGTCSVLPEVILLAEAEYLLGRNAYLVMPDIPRLVIVEINRGIEPVRVEADPFLAREELPAPRYCLVLEVIAEGEVSEHLEISAVACGVTDIVDIAGTDALLAGAHALARRYLLTLEPWFHRGHAGVYEQDGFVVLRNQREAGQPEVILALKKAQEHLS